MMRGVVRLGRFAISLCFLLGIGVLSADEPSYDPTDTGATSPAEVEQKPDKAGIWRHPVAIAWHPSRDRLLVLCRRFPSLWLVPIDGESEPTSFPLTGRPEAMVVLADGRVVVADGEGNRLWVLQVHPSRIESVKQIAVGDEPRQLLADADGLSVWVSLRSAHQLSRIRIDSGEVVSSTPLPFAPHRLALDPRGESIFVADAYRGQLAAVSTTSGQIQQIRPYPGTNIRGLAVTPDGEQIVIAHQLISERSLIEREPVRWGAFITNNVRRISRSAFFDPSIDPLKGSELGFVGDFGNGAGDPGQLIWKDGLAILCCEGVNEIGVDTSWPLRLTRINVGRRPVDVVVDEDQKYAYVANMFDDSVAVVDLDHSRVEQVISLGPKPAESAEIRGEILFHDAGLSLDRWYSCQSCHTDGHTNGSNSDTFSDGNHGAPKNTPSLLGVADTGPWSWTGAFDKLEDQVASSIEHTMQSRRISRAHSEDLAAYLATLKPRPAETQAVVDAGRQTFEVKGCAQCHAGAELTSDELFDVGLDDGLAGHREFNPPSLRNVRQSAPYFHDGRAQTLEEVIDTYRHRLKDPLTEDERGALLTYLKSL